jgi:hypothetical protein
LVPLSALGYAKTLDIASLDKDPSEIGFGGSRNYTIRYNFDGLLTAGQMKESDRCSNYVQFYRSGIVEAVSVDLLKPGRDGSKVISPHFEDEILDGLERLRKAQKKIGVEMPVLLMLSLTDVDGYRMGMPFDPFDRWLDHQPNERKELAVPEVLTETYEDDLAMIMRPAFDAIWMACDYPGSINYGDKGNRRPRQ